MEKKNTVFKKTKNQSEFVFSVFILVSFWCNCSVFLASGPALWWLFGVWMNQLYLSGSTCWFIVSDFCFQTSREGYVRIWIHAVWPSAAVEMVLSLMKVGQTELALSCLQSAKISPENSLRDLRNRLHFRPLVSCMLAGSTGNLYNLLVFMFLLKLNWPMGLSAAVWGCGGHMHSLTPAAFLWLKTHGIILQRSLGVFYLTLQYQQFEVHHVGF